MTIGLPRVRYPGVPDCTHTGAGVCRSETCRYSLRPDNQSETLEIRHVPPFRVLTLASGRPLVACALDAAQCGPLDYDDIGQLLGGVTGECVRQWEETALRKLKRPRRLEQHRDRPIRRVCPHGPETPRRPQTGACIACNRDWRRRNAG